MRSYQCAHYCYTLSDDAWAVRREELHQQKLEELQFRMVRLGSLMRSADVITVLILIVVGNTQEERQKIEERVHVSIVFMFRAQLLSFVKHNKALVEQQEHERVHVSLSDAIHRCEWCAPH